MIIYKMKSIPTMTEYAPTWDFSFGVNKWQDSDKIKTIRNWLIANENRIINSYSGDYDGGTGLGNNSLTGRFEKYNLFDYADELPELNDMLKFFRISYLEFLEEEQHDVRDTVLVCWYNVMREGEFVAEHHHGAGYDVYLSGNIMLDTYPTCTNYTCPYDKDVKLPFSNNEGILTIFPSCIPHHSDPYHGEGVRISIAFDIRLPSIQENADRKAITFMNEEIFNQLSSE